MSLLLLFQGGPQGAVVAITAAACATFYVQAEWPTLTLSDESPTVSVSADDPTFVIGGCG